MWCCLLSVLSLSGSEVCPSYAPRGTVISENRHGISAVGSHVAERELA